MSFKIKIGLLTILSHLNSCSGLTIENLQKLSAPSEQLPNKLSADTRYDRLALRDPKRQRSRWELRRCLDGPATCPGRHSIELSCFLISSCFTNTCSYHKPNKCSTKKGICSNFPTFQLSNSSTFNRKFSVPRSPCLRGSRSHSLPGRPRPSPAPRLESARG